MSLFPQKFRKINLINVLLKLFGKTKVFEDDLGVLVDHDVGGVEREVGHPVGTNEEHSLDYLLDDEQFYDN